LTKLTQLSPNELSSYKKFRSLSFDNNNLNLMTWMKTPLHFKWIAVEGIPIGFLSNVFVKYWSILLIPGLEYNADPRIGV